MLTRVLIQKGSRQFRFVTTIGPGRVLWQLATIVQVELLWDMRSDVLVIPDLAFRIAEAAFANLPHYPIEFGKWYDLAGIDWMIHVDCANQHIHIGKVATRNRDAYINFGESADKLRREEF